MDALRENPGGWLGRPTPGAGGLGPLLAYDLGTGRLAWRADLPATVQVPPVPVAGGRLIQPAGPNYFCAA